MKGITNASGGIPTGAVNTSMLGDSAVTTAKIANAAVTRAKLAQDALYSPWVSMSAGTTTLSAAHIGKTFRSSNGSEDFVLDVGLLGTSIPSGAEFGIFRNWAKTFKIVFAEGTSAAIEGQTAYLANPIVSVPNNLQMIALKKIVTDSGKDYWLVTGKVEVVE